MKVSSYHLPHQVLRFLRTQGFVDLLAAFWFLTVSFNPNDRGSPTKGREERGEAMFGSGTHAPGR